MVWVGCSLLEAQQLELQLNIVCTHTHTCAHKGTWEYKGNPASSLGKGVFSGSNHFYSPQEKKGLGRLQTFLWARPPEGPRSGFTLSHTVIHNRGGGQL